MSSYSEGIKMGRHKEQFEEYGEKKVKFTVYLTETQLEHVKEKFGKNTSKKLRKYIQGMLDADKS